MTLDELTWTISGTMVAASIVVKLHQQLHVGWLPATAGTVVGMLALWYGIKGLAFLASRHVATATAKALSVAPVTESAQCDDKITRPTPISSDNPRFGL